MKRLALLFCLAAAGCGGASDDASGGDTVGKEIADDYQEAMDEAAEVEQKLQDAKDRIDDALEDADDTVKD